MASAQSFPRHSARTQGFSLGAPRNFTVAADGRSVVFLRSSTGTDRSNALWTWNSDSRDERLLVDPERLLGQEEISPEEQARRERSRERATGITTYATDRDVRRVVFTASGRLFTTDLTTGTTTELPVAHPVLDPRPDPSGTAVAYVSGGALRVVDVDGSRDRALVTPEREGVHWGTAEFIAAEEMDRHRGYWWSPDGTALLVGRVDEAPLQHWYLADPAEPGREPTDMRYPAAGTANAEVTLALVGLDGDVLEVTWDRETYPYLVTTHWSAHGPPLVAVQSRDQQTQLVLAIDTATGATREQHRDTDPRWLEIKPGWPQWTPDGELVRVASESGTYRLVVDGRAWTEPSLQVRGVLDVESDDILISASEDEPTEVHVYRAGPNGTERITTETGVHAASRAGGTLVLRSAGLERLATRTRVLDGAEPIAEIVSHADTPAITPNVDLVSLGSRELRSALLLPTGHRPEHGKLPVLLDPYGGPQTQRVLARQQGYLTSQWFADQGFAVLITDGRGMAGRGPEWEHAIAGDLAGPPLQDQVDALHAAAEHRQDLDLERVGIRGWSFGGYLAALAVLRRPDVFHAAIAGAPVCDWRLYDTHYTERYLGLPDENPDVYERNSLLGDCAELRRPMLVVHGTVDDNVVLAHSLRLSAALTASARPHSVLPLPGVSHMPTDENTSENILLLQIQFLRDALTGGEHKLGGA